MDVPDAALRRSPQATCVLKLIDLHDQEQFDRLLQQRIQCGWYNNPKALEAWRDDMDENKNPMFWIFVPSQREPIGHIGLTTDMEPADLELANPDKSVVMLSRLFIYAEHRSGGVGRAAVQQAEAMAKVTPYGSPHCKVVTVHTTSRRYIEDDEPEWRGAYGKMVKSMPPKGEGRSAEDWYTRMGYVKWKEQPSYYNNVLDDGTPISLTAVFMSKRID